jgi:hypothetical protein
MNKRHPSQPRQIEVRRDDDTPGAPVAPWPWIEPASGQASRSEHQQLTDLGEVSCGR